MLDTENRFTARQSILLTVSLLYVTQPMRKKYMPGVFDCPYPTQSLLTSCLEWWASQDYTFLLVQLTRKNIFKQFNLGHSLDFEIPKIYVWRLKHRKNGKCCPGHYLIVNNYSSFSISCFNFRNFSVIVNFVTKVANSLNRSQSKSKSKSLSL